MLWRSSWLTRWMTAWVVVGWLGSQISTAAAEDYLITVIDARIASKKQNGKNWDISFFRSKYPDAFVVITLGNHKLTTPVLRNTLLPRWNISRKFSLKGTDKVTIVVWDRDRLSKNDLIGKTSLTFEELRRHDSLTFGQVLSLRIKVTSLQPPPRPIVRAPEPRRDEPTPPRQAQPERRTPPRVAVQPPARPPVRPPVAPQPIRRAAPVPDTPENVFCLAMIQQSLGCMKKQQEAFLKSGDPNKLRIATALDRAVKQAEQALKDRGRVFQIMMMRCRGTIKREGWLTTEACWKCAKQQGCVRSSELKSVCRKVCMANHNVTARRIPTAPPLFPPSNVRSAPQRPAPTRPVERRTEPAPERRTEPVPAPRRDTTAPETRDSAPETRREAPAPMLRQTEPVPTPRREVPAPETRREAPTTRREAPTTRQEAPAPKARQVEPVPTPRREAAVPEARREIPPANQPPVARRAVPAPHQAASASRPANAAQLSPQKFCTRFLALRIQCLKRAVDKEKGTGTPSPRVRLLDTLLKQLQKEQGKHQQKCVKGVLSEQQRRGQGTNPLTSAQLAACWQCLKQAGCNSTQQRTCRSVCTQ